MYFSKLGLLLFFEEFQQSLFFFVVKTPSVSVPGKQVYFSQTLTNKIYD